MQIDWILAADIQRLLSWMSTCFSILLICGQAQNGPATHAIVTGAVFSLRLYLEANFLPYVVHRGARRVLG